MKMIGLFCIIACLPLCDIAQEWTSTQLDAANTAKTVTGITAVERETIMYINLARLYPRQFALREVPEGERTTYRTSLMIDLNRMQPVPALVFDSTMYDLAACFALESGELGLEGHNRIHCKGGYMAECCSYGMKEAKDIALQWLIDEDIASLGHRKICLDGRYHAVGISVFKHKTYRFCAVADFK